MASNFNVQVAYYVIGITPSTFYQSVCANAGKCAVMYLLAMCIYFASFYDFSIRF